MTDCEAIAVINIMQAKYNQIRKSDIEFEAMEIAKEALREKAERENPKPLTLDELREMVGEPVYIVQLIDGKLNFDSELSRWDILTAIDDDDSDEDDPTAWFTEDENEILEDYDETWIVYRYKPKEEQKRFDQHCCSDQKPEEATNEQNR